MKNNNHSSVNEKHVGVLVCRRQWNVLISCSLLHQVWLENWFSKETFIIKEISVGQFLYKAVLLACFVTVYQFRN